VAETKTFRLLHLGVVGKNDRDVTGIDAHDQSLSGSCSNDSLCTLVFSPLDAPYANPTNKQHSNAVDAIFGFLVHSILR
jgi:hypothetical protein